MTIHGSNFSDGGVAPIVDFGSVASIGSMSYSSNQITTTIPPSMNAGTVDITVTTPAGTSAVSPSDQYTYVGPVAPSGPAITSGNQVTFSAGTAGVFDITTTGTPDATVSDTAFGGCTPSTLPASVTLQRAGGGTPAILEGTPQRRRRRHVHRVPDRIERRRHARDASLHVDRRRTARVVPRHLLRRHRRAPSHGYWLVGSDGGIFSFGSAQFHGSTGSMHLQRPVVGITPTADRGGYWLVASDGGIFAFGDAGFYGSIPGERPEPGRLGPAAQPQCAHRRHGALLRRRRDTSWWHPTAASSPSGTPGSRGPAQASAAVRALPSPSCPTPPATATGSSRAPAPSIRSATLLNYGAPGTQGSAITSAVATPDGRGYWILDAAGQVFPFGDAAGLGGLPAGSAGVLDPASAIFATSDGGGYWVATALGKVSNFGDAPNDGDMSGTHLNGPIIAASGS